MTPEQLKTSILQYVIQGKFVEQRPEEQVDLSRIKSKKTDAIEFDIPDSWLTAHLESITKSVASKQYQIAASDFRKAGKYPVVSQSKEYIIGYNDDETKLYRHENPVVVFGDHTTEVKYVDFDFIVGADGVKIFEPIETVVNGKFLKYVFEFYTSGLEKVGGYSRHYKFIKDKAFPIPPLSEQKRIVAKIEELLPYVDRYALAYEKLEQFNAKFPEDMKKSILQYAIQGKLVEQRPEEGTGEELYRQIQAEKQRLIKEGRIKKDKPLPEIGEDEKPFDIPESWKWVRFGNIISLLSGTDFKPEDYNDQRKGTVYITGASNLSDTGVIVSRWTEKPSILATVGDVLLVCKGSGYGKTVICDVPKAHIARQIMAIKKYDFLCMEYMKYYLQASIQLIKSKGQGVIPGIDRITVLNMLFPLPPLAEQKRIVVKLEEILPLCERLK